MQQLYVYPLQDGAKILLKNKTLIANINSAISGNGVPHHTIEDYMKPTETWTGKQQVKKWYIQFMQDEANRKKYGYIPNLGET